MHDKTGMIFLPTSSAIALWCAEITGQLSDGLWENSRPHDHWKFWCRLDVKLGIPLVTPECAFPLKHRYNLLTLVPIVGDRMIKIGKMGTALSLLVDPSPEQREILTAAEDMPETLDEWLLRKASDDWSPTYVAKYMAHVSADVARAYYAVEYGTKQMKADLVSIKAAMKSAAE